MWFEILPTLLIITASVGVPHGLAYILNYVALRHFYRRNMETYQQRLQYLRDRRLSGNPYKLNGLEHIPDEEPCQEEEGNGVDEECCEEEKEEQCEDSKSS